NGNLDLNVMMPVIAHALLESITITVAAARVFARKCVRGIQANVERCRQYAELTGQLVTAIAPVVGYDRAAEIYKKAVKRDLPIRQILAEDGILPQAEIDRLLDLHRLARGRRAGSRWRGASAPSWRWAPRAGSSRTGGSPWSGGGVRSTRRRSRGRAGRRCC